MNFGYYKEGHGYGYVVSGKQVWLNGEKLPDCPTKKHSTTVVQEDGNLYLNGWEWKNGKWRRTLKAILKCLLF